MITKTFKDRLLARELLIGPLITLSPDVAEILAGAGFDWLWLEMEHAPSDLQMIQRMLQAIGGRCPALVRVPWNDSVWIKRVLDLGCDGVIVPQITSAEEARAAVAACKYPPAGIRSVGIARAHDYGMQLQGYIDRANDDVVVVVQIEHVKAVNNIDSILSVQGIDAVVIGPYDLSASMALIGQVAHADVQGALTTIKKACAKHGVPVGVFTGDATAANAQIDSGCSLIALGIDVQYLWKAAQAALRDIASRQRANVAS